MLANVTGSGTGPYELIKLRYEKISTDSVKKASSAWVLKGLVVPVYYGGRKGGRNDNFIAWMTGMNSFLDDVAGSV